MYTPKPIPSQPNQGKGGQSMASSTRPAKPQGGIPADTAPAPSKLVCTSTTALGAGTKGSSGKVNSVPPRCGSSTY